MGGAEGDAGVVDPVSTVSSRIALLPSECVSRVAHSPRRACTVLRGACKSAAHARFSLPRVTFVASRRDTRDFPISRFVTSTACHIAEPSARTIPILDTV